MHLTKGMFQIFKLRGARKPPSAGLPPVFVDFAEIIVYYSYMKPAEAREKLARTAVELGAAVLGVCEVGDLIERFHPEIRRQAESLPRAVSVGVELQPAVLQTITQFPTQVYKFHYRAANARLDDITFRLSREISQLGGQALPIPASKLMDHYPAHLSHREIAHKAGLGWRGKNNLLVHPVYGSRLRLATVLTDLELLPDIELADGCGSCTACAKHCPAGAIGDTPEAFRLEPCRELLIRFSRENHLGHMICGFCLNWCPKHGKKETVRQE